MIDKPFEEAPGVYRVDLRWNGLPGQVAAYLVDDGDALAVVETGPTRTLPAVLDCIRGLGRTPGDVTHVLVTHVHLDHAGGAGALLGHAPRAKVYAHPRAAPHLADPSRLVASATRLYGEQMDALWGEMVPVPGDRLVVLQDGERVEIGSRALVALDTPGHAGHHHAFHDPAAGLVFTGDVGGIRLNGARYVSAPTPPPDIDVDAWLRSLDRLRALQPALLLPTHFGGVRDAAWHLDDLAGRLRGWAAWTGAKLAAGVRGRALADAMREQADADIVAATGSPETANAYEVAVPYPMMAAGLERWWTLHRAER